MHKHHREAKQRFSDIWVQAQHTFDTGTLPAAPLPVPGHCISTVSRLIASDSDCVQYCEQMQEEIDQVSQKKMVYFYPRESIHISLLGCTQRTEKIPFDKLQTQNIKKAVDPIISELLHHDNTFQIGGLNFLSGQFFIEAYPTNKKWSATRFALGTALHKIGEQPITYKNTEPVHINIARVIRGNKLTTKQRNTLDQLHRKTGPKLHIQSVELVETDFTLSPKNLRVITHYAK